VDYRGYFEVTNDEMEASQVRVVAIWRPFVEWQREGVAVSSVQVVFLWEVIRGVAARKDVGADGSHSSWAD
jgi:hypothetical protein